MYYGGFLGGTMVKNSPANTRYTRDVGSIPGSGRCPGGGNGNPLQYFCLGNPMHRGAWWATVHGAAKSQIWLSPEMWLAEKFSFLNFLELWLCMWHSSVQFNTIINILDRVSNKAVNLIKKGPVSAEIHPSLDLAVEILPKSWIAIFATILILESKITHPC